MKSLEELKNIVSWSELPYKQDVIERLEQCETMENMLRGNCWACKHGKSYRKQFGGVFENNSKLTICRIGKHDENTIAKTSAAECESWELK